MTQAPATALAGFSFLDLENLTEKERSSTKSRTDCGEATVLSNGAALPMVKFRGRTDGLLSHSSRIRSVRPVY